jgi:PUA-domain protein
MKQIPLKVKELNKEIELYGISYHKKDQAVIIEDEKFKLVLVDKKPEFFYYENKIVPTLKLLQQKDVLKKITVDMGAVKFVINGADIMRPGIVEIEDGINENDFIVVVDVNNKKPLAVGIALLNSEEMRSATSGKVIKNIHFVGDELWKWE